MDKLKIEITLEDFDELSLDQKLHAIYKAATGSDRRITALERRKIKDTGLAALLGTCAGLLGGVFKGKIL